MVALISGGDYDKKRYVVERMILLYIKWTCGSCLYMQNAAFTENSDLLESCCCFVIHYTDVSKYSVDRKLPG